MMMVMPRRAHGATEVTVEVLVRGGRGPGAWPGPGGGLGTEGDVVSGPEGGEVVTSAGTGTSRLTPRVH